MFLACVELGARNQGGVRRQGGYGTTRVLELQFAHFETAKVWAEQEATRHHDATGNAAVFETLGPFVSLAWEQEAPVTPDFDTIHPGAHHDRLVESA